MARHLILLCLALHLDGSPANVRLELTDEHRRGLRDDDLDLQLSVTGIEFAERPLGSYAVYVGLTPDERTFDPESEHFVGTVTFFGTHPGQPFDVQFSVKPAIAAAFARDAQLDAIDVTFVPHGPPTVTATPILIRGVRLESEPA
ncbi:MAG TPA: hypothetical protein VGF69_01925 [Thermoanaerobaculia bacterium]|jgi:hypothetical protein